VLFVTATDGQTAYHTVFIYRVIQEEMPVFWDVIVSVVVRERKVFMNMYLILNV
jgi:hypothetical protein